MRPNPLLEKCSSGGIALGGWASIPSVIAAEAMAGLGLDYVCIDRQHGPVGFSDMVAMLAAVTNRGPTPVVRVEANTPPAISTALDAGAMAVIVPLVNSAEEAAAAVASCRYPPEGDRSYGPTRVGPVEGADYFERANRDVMCIPMVETTAALDDLDGILSVPGVDAVYVGPSDLSITLGHPPGSEHPDLLDALAKIVEGCRRHGVVPGIQATPNMAEDRLGRGFRMVTPISDLTTLRSALAKAANEARALVSEEAAPVEQGESGY